MTRRVISVESFEYLKEKHSQNFQIASDQRTILSVSTYSSSSDSDATIAVTEILYSLETLLYCDLSPQAADNIWADYEANIE